MKVENYIGQRNPENEDKWLAVNIYLFIRLLHSFSLSEIKRDIRMFFFMQKIWDWDEKKICILDTLKSFFPSVKR